MSYQSQREKVILFLNGQILPLLKKKDINYNELIFIIKENTFVNDNIIDEVIRSYIKQGKFKEIHILTIPDKEIENWLIENKKEEEEMKKVEEIIKEAKEGEI